MNLRRVIRPNFEKRGGLVDVVTQDANTREVLMKTSANEEAWRKTLETGIATYWSTSRNKLWVKGEESGNFMVVVDILVDCDGDALVYMVHPQGDRNACHTGARKCFYRSIFLNRPQDPAPKAGAKEALGQMQLNLHERLR